MYSGYLYPFYRSFAIPYPYINPVWGFGGIPNTFGFGSNIIGSAIANQSVVNTGNIAGFTQTATPTVIW